MAGCRSPKLGLEGITLVICAILRRPTPTASEMGNLTASYTPSVREAASLTTAGSLALVGLEDAGEAADLLN